MKNKLNKAFRKAITIANKIMAKNEQLRSVYPLEWGGNSFLFGAEVCDENGENYRTIQFDFILD